MEERIIYALGYFDGVHLGHRALLEACREMAQEQSCKAGAVTFLGHPEAILKQAAPGLINTPDDRNKLLLQFHMDTVVELPFDEKLMQMPWQDFLALLEKDYGAAGFVCGTDFRFGSGGTGTALALQQYCREHNLSCKLINQQYLDGIRISSTHIRQLLQRGEVAEANRFLGHPHILSGIVQPGKQLGRTIGIPTANLCFPQELEKLPYGVYACYAQTEDRVYTAMTNIGTRPTVSGTGVTVESCLLDFSGDLYGKSLTLFFYEFLRPEYKFPNLSSLQKQVEKDKFIVEKVMQNHQLHP